MPGVVADRRSYGHRVAEAAVKRSAMTWFAAGKGGQSAPMLAIAAVTTPAVQRAHQDTPGSQVRFQSPSGTQAIWRNPTKRRPENSREINRLRLFTKTPKPPQSTGSEKSGAERTDFGGAAGTGVNSPAATTLENNDKFRLGERAENGLRQGLG